jgi:hypothetical protein
LKLFTGEQFLRHKKVPPHSSTACLNAASGFAKSPAFFHIGMAFNQ